MLAPAADIVRLSLHVAAATVWVGGQFVLAGLVPELRRLDPGALPAVARRFATLAWPAYFVLIVTGMWNVSSVHPSSQGAAYEAVFGVKVAVVVLSGAAAWGHQRATTPRVLAVTGAASSLAALTALVLGVALGG